MNTNIINHDPNAAPPPPPRQIRFVNNQGHPPSKRRRINAACLTCRRRKTRCAGERPLCSTCTKNGHKCLGYPEEKEKKDSGERSESKHYADDDRQDADDSREDENRAKKLRVAADATRRAPERTTSATPKLQPGGTQHVQSASTPNILTSRASESPALPNARAPLPASPQIGHAHSAQTHSSYASYPEDPDSPSMRRNPPTAHRVPFFRYFGPTAIVPGYKQMVVSVRDRRRSINGSHSGTSPLSNPSGVMGSTSAADSDIIIEEPPVYDPNDLSPVHPLTLSLVKTFFVHLGCNYPFLNQRKFMRMVKEKLVEPILVDAVCALAARFSDSQLLTGGNDKMVRAERGQVFAQRAKQATVDTFPCPTVAAVQACLLMAYEGFGANQDSALWMYLGLAIRMAVDLGLQKRVGTLYQGEQDPWNTQQRRTIGDAENIEEHNKAQSDIPSQEEQKELEQERIDTFWAVFVLDRVISSGTGRPVTLRDEDFELAFPEPVLSPATKWPTPFPILLDIIHLYGQVCDVLNNIHGASDLTQEKWQKLMAMEHRLTKVYKNWDARLQFNVINFKAYLNVGQGTTFILLHFWFHALFIILHQPTLMTPFGELKTEFQLLSDSRELSMSSAKTICDILSFADLIDPKSFVGNPFTSQPIYIAACAFLMESSASASASENTSRETSPPPKDRRQGKSTDKKSRHSLLASAASQNYQRCYSSLEHLQTYWGGVKYILTALDQKAKGIWDCETFTSEEYESTKFFRRESFGSQLRFENPTSSPKMTGPPIAWSLAGTTNSPSSSMTLMYPNLNAAVVATPHSQGIPKPGSTPPANAVVDPMRQTGMFPPRFPQPTTSAVRGSPSHPNHLDQHIMRPDNLQDAERANLFIPPNYTSPNNSFEGYASPTSTNAPTTTSNTHTHYPHGMSYPTAWGNMHGITFDSQDIDIGALGLHQPELMGPWLDYIPDDVLGLFDQHEMGHGGH